MKIIQNVMLVLSFVGLSACAAAGWGGYYQTYPETDLNKYIAESSINSTKVKSLRQEMWVELPMGCSGFSTIGLFTPFTPPIPVITLRNITFFDTPCNYFSISSKPEATSVRLVVDNQTFEPEISDERWDYTKYKFPIKSSKIDSGVLIIEKDGETAEIPFEYKYFKFWY